MPRRVRMLGGRRPTNPSGGNRGRRVGARLWGLYGVGCDQSAGSATNRREGFLAAASLRAIQQSSVLRQEFQRQRPEAAHSAVAAARQCRRPERTNRSGRPVDLWPSTHGDLRLHGWPCNRSAAIWPPSRPPVLRTTLPRVQHGALSGSPISAATPASTRR